MNFKDRYNERNQRIINLHNKGFSWNEIGSLLEITPSCAHNAYDRYFEKTRERTGFEKLLEESCKELSIPCNNGVISRICNCLKAAGIYSLIEENPSELNNFSDKYFLSLKNFGKKSLKILRNIKIY